MDPSSSLFCLKAKIRHYTFVFLQTSSVNGTDSFKVTIDYLKVNNPSYTFVAAISMDIFMFKGEKQNIS